MQNHENNQWQKNWQVDMFEWLAKIQNEKIVINSLIPHDNPHMDELAALALLREHGRDIFPGVQVAKIAAFSTGAFPEGVSWKDFPQHIFLGCALSPFDEHKIAGEKFECCATLVAKALKVDRWKAFEKVLTEITEGDKELVRLPKGQNHLSHVLKSINIEYKNVKEASRWYNTVFWAEVEKEEAVWNDIQQTVDEMCLKGKEAVTSAREVLWEKHKKTWKPTTLQDGFELIKTHHGEDSANRWLAYAQTALDRKQKRFLAAQEEYRLKANVIPLALGEGKTVKMGIIESDSDQMNPAARSLGAIVVVQKNGNGNVQIFTRHDAKIDLSEVAYKLRLREQELRGEVKVSDPRILRQTDTIDEVPYWHLHNVSGPKSQLYNGTLSASAVDPTAISLDEIVHLIKLGINHRVKYQASPLENRLPLPVQKTKSGSPRVNA